MIIKTIEAMQIVLEDKVALLNRLIRQHQQNPTWMSWVDMKEFIEKELLGYEVTREM